MKGRTMKVSALLIGIAIGVLISRGGVAVAPTVTNTASVAAVDQIPEVKEFALQVLDGKATSGGGDITVYEGDVVSVSVFSDGDDELYLYGYNKSVELSKGATGTLSFIANMKGKFPLELTSPKRWVGSVTVKEK